MSLPQRTPDCLFLLQMTVSIPNLPLSGLWMPAVTLTTHPVNHWLPNLVCMDCPSHVPLFQRLICVLIERPPQGHPDSFPLGRTSVWRGTIERWITWDYWTCTLWWSSHANMKFTIQNPRYTLYVTDAWNGYQSILRFLRFFRSFEIFYYIFENF